MYLARDLSAAETVFRIRSNELLASNTSVAARPSIADRQAMIETLLNEERERITTLQSQLRSTQHIKGIVRFRKGELDGTMSSIRQQGALLKAQLRSGSFYGDETERSRGGRAPDPVDSMDHVDLEALVAASEVDLDVERAARKAKPVEPAVPADPIDSLDANALEALISGNDDAVPSNADEKSSIDEDIARFLAEPDIDVESLVANL